ncbi:hypothetical protein KI387_038045 [Taxus chinensis]|uniref:ABC transporter domain-containing protein n=1 Tax=Taxus chinensis TaxID=29808 RepID=A0AA38FTQ9_TAXCH|nr:hypothetical protein KI387_038045 [Taxus chinensis]
MGSEENHVVITCEHHRENAVSLSVKPAQVIPEPVADPPTRSKSYELEARNLFYKIVPGENNLWKRLFCGSGYGTSGKYILKNVSCEARPGEILAIAGPSGAGKSTLLELLAGRLNPSSGSKSVLVNRQAMNRGHFRKISGYVTQEEALFPFLTVEETLMFSARLRLPGSVPRSEKASRVRALMAELGLSHVAGSRIGNEEVRGISGGERRRVSIGVEVIHDPAVLLLDEPTSGLDSAAALQVTAMLKSMAETHGRTIILSIHQPGFRILQLFDRILLLSDGSVVHHGSLDALGSRLRLSGHDIPPHVNVLEYAIDVVDCLAGTAYKTHQNSSPAHDQTTLAVSSSSPVVYANSAIHETGILVHRFGKNVYRTKQLFTARTLQALVAGIGLGTVFMNTRNDKSGLQDRLGFFAFTLTFLLSSTTEGLPIFLEERNILMRETSRGAYRVSSYVIANAVIFLPFLLLVALLYSTPVYWLIGLSSHPAAFLYFVLLVWVVLFMANSFVVCLSALVPNFIMGNSVIAGFMGAFFLFSGYFISKQNIPDYWIWMHYLSLFKYPFEAFIINEYSHVGSQCLDSMFGQCVLDGNGLLAQEGLHFSEKWSNLGVMLMFIVVYRILCFIILWYRCSCNRR